LNILIILINEINLANIPLGAPIREPPIIPMGMTIFNLVRLMLGDCFGITIPETCLSVEELLGAWAEVSQRRGIFLAFVIHVIISESINQFAT
jgi:hypothetical protein